VESQLDYWPYRDPARYKNPAGALVKAIEQNWAAPEGWRRHQKRLAREAQRQLQDRLQADLQADETAAHAAFEARWAALPQTEREALSTQARQELIGASDLIARHYARHPDRLHEALRPILMRLLSA
jgi:hypothetical protein